MFELIYIDFDSKLKNQIKQIKPKFKYFFLNEFINYILLQD